jgi:hypothetical protein
VADSGLAGSLLFGVPDWTIPADDFDGNADRYRRLDQALNTNFVGQYGGGLVRAGLSVTLVR